VAVLKADWLPPAGGHVLARLFDDVELDILIAETRMAYGAVVTRGNVGADPDSLCMFAACEGAMSGIIHTPDGRHFLILPGQEGTSVIAETDP
jgi:hypothetical protein